MEWEIDAARGFITQVRWQYAVTMPEWPHEYMVKGRRPARVAEFVAFCQVIALIGRWSWRGRRRAGWPSGRIIGDHHEALRRGRWHVVALPRTTDEHLAPVRSPKASASLRTRWS